MPAYNFQSLFANLVEHEVKLQTIRARRKYRPRVGQIAYCFEGMRTLRCRRIGDWPIVAVRECLILEYGVIVDRETLDARLLDSFAAQDGFADWTMMRDWFRRTHGLPFHGDLIEWKPTQGED